MEVPDLPQEILLEIFSITPTKLVGKCRTLSKSWNTNLSTITFIKRHLTFRKQENLALITRDLITQHVKLCIITPPTRNDFNGSLLLSVRDSCTDLVLLHGRPEGVMMLVNPVTLKQVTIQPNQFNNLRQQMDCITVVYGFGYDSCSDDYKVVKIRCYSLKNGGGEELAKTFVDVYYVKNGIWERLDDGCYPYGRYFSPDDNVSENSGAFLNGAVHWIIGREGYRSCITAFDLANHVFQEIPLPKDFVRQRMTDSNWLTSQLRCNKVCVVGGCLSIVDNNGDGVSDIWIMREYGEVESWVRFRIENEERKWCSITSTLCFVETGELLCLTCKENYVLSCDLKGGKVALCEGDSFSHGVTFVDSLVSP